MFISELLVRIYFLIFIAANVRRFLLHNGISVFNPDNLKNDISQLKSIGGYSQDSRFTTADPVRDGPNWYAYANNNPLRFVDPTGLAPIDKVISLLFVDNLVSVGDKPKVSGSLYSNQYTTERERERGMKTVLQAIGAVPTKVTEAIGALATFIPESDIDESVVLYPDRGKFMTGAEKEINNIDSILSDIDEDIVNSAGASFVDYLSDQKEILGRELSENKEYDDIQQKEIDGLRTAEPLNPRSSEPDVEQMSYTNYYNDFMDSAGKEFEE